MSIATTEWMLERYSRRSDSGCETFTNDQRGKLVLSLTGTGQLLIMKRRLVLESHHLPTMTKTMRGCSKFDSLLIMVKAETKLRQYRLKFAASEGQSPNARCQQCAKRLGVYFVVNIVPDSDDAKTVIPDSVSAVLESSLSDIAETQDPDVLYPSASPRCPAKKETSTQISQSVSRVAETQDLTGITASSVDSRLPLTGEATLSQVSQSILGQGNMFPSIYDQLGGDPVSVDDLDTFVRICLTDSSFPSFVAKVEKILHDTAISGE